MESKHHRPSAGLIVACIALVLSLAGSAAALPGKNKVDKNDIKKGAVTKKAIKKGAVTKKAIANAAVRSKAIERAAVKTAKIASQAVTSGKLAAGAVTNEKLADNAVTGAKVEDESLSAGDISDVTLSGLKKVNATSGANFDAAREAAQPVTLAQRGPFTVYGKCFTDVNGPTTYAYTYISTTEAGSVVSAGDDTLAGDPFLDPDTDETDRELYDVSISTDAANGFRNMFDAASPNGTLLNGIVTQYAKNGTLPGGNGIYGDGDVCLFGASVLG